jgi:hypothetical protein
VKAPDAVSGRCAARQHLRYQGLRRSDGTSCENYSTANARRRGELELWETTRSLIHRLPARFWVVENVRGAVAYWGLPAFRWEPWFLWTNPSELTPPLGSPTSKMLHDSALERARIPSVIAERVVIALDRARRVR